LGEPDLKTSHATTNHPPPLRRFVRMLLLERKDLAAIVVFSLVASILSLVSPLAVEALVNVVSWGIYLQPLIILAMVLLVSLSFQAILSVLQALVVEVVQRRQFVRIVGDLAHRFPQVARSQLVGIYPRELANRLFDIMTIQKATAVLLLDGISIILISLIGLCLLGFYHPFLLGFDVILITLMTLVTWGLGWGGVRTSIQESATKYRTVHWLQDVLDTPSAFQINGGRALAISRSSLLAADYVRARKNHFRVYIRQIAFAAGVNAFALTALLGLGGWLVIHGELTLGQLVASELVVTMVLAAFTKAGKSIEKFYDLMAGMDKIGHLLDLQTTQEHPNPKLYSEPVEVEWTRMVTHYGTQQMTLEPCRIPAGSMLAIVTHQYSSLVMKVLTGTLTPDSGKVSIQGVELERQAVGCQQGRLMGYAAPAKIFAGTILDNIALQREGIDENRCREVLEQVGLWKQLANLPQGLLTSLQTGGFPLTKLQCHQLMIAQAVAAGPRLLLIEDLMDHLSPADQEELMGFLKSQKATCTIILTTGSASIANRCDDQIHLEA
jgi:putative ABC transport system ATP-binding protein